MESSSLTLFCYDGSSSSKHAIAVAGKIISTDKAVLLHVWDPPIEALADSYSDPGTPAGNSLGELEADAIDRATAIATEGVQLAGSVGLDAEIRLERSQGDDWPMILNVASSLDADLIVLGTRGLTALQDGLLGTSVSKDVLRHSTHPVLLVPALSETGPPSEREKFIRLGSGRG
jgi:nucleotide-binding universal stress UspA family protein